MTIRGLILTIHDKGCFPWMVPVVKRITKVAGVIAAVCIVYALAAG